MEQQSIRNEEGKVMISKVKQLIKSLGFRIEGDAAHGYKLEIGEPERKELVEDVDWSRAGVDPTYVWPKSVVITESTIRSYKITKEELIKAAERYLYLMALTFG